MTPQNLSLFLVLMEDCAHAWNRVAWMHWDTPVEKIEWNDKHKVWRIHFKGVAAKYIIVVSEDGNTIWPHDCLVRLEYNGDGDCSKAWNSINLTEEESEMVKWRD